MEQTITTTIIDVIAITLGVAALILTIVGFIASIIFYKDAVALQKVANEALTKLELTTQFIQSQVDSIFAKTLDAALEKRQLISAGVADLNADLDEHLKETKTKIIEEALKQIGNAGEQQRKNLAKVVDDEIERFRKRVETTQESVESLVSSDLQPPSSDIGTRILLLLKRDGGELSASEIAERLRKDYAEIIASLRVLSQQRLVIPKGQGRRQLYRINSENLDSQLH